MNSEKEIYDKILEKLYETERNYDVKIILAIESGSRGWGFASPDSDFDCRFIYVNKKDWYLSILDKKDNIEYEAGKVFDINGWDLKKVMKHILKSNAVMLEWLSSNEIYIKNEKITKELENLAKEFFNPISVSYHYLSIAKNKLRELLLEENGRLKTYFYILRAILNADYVNKYKKMPYMELEKTIKELNIKEEVLSEIRKLQNIKKDANESYTLEKNEILINYFNDLILKSDETLKEMRFEKNKNISKADEVFRKIIEMSYEND